MKKILFFSPYFYPYVSGITTYPLKILTHLAQHNDITVLTFRHNKQLPPFEKIQNLKVNRMGFVFSVSKGFISPQSWVRFFQEARRCDTVILNIPNAEGLLLALFAKWYGKKIISIYHCQVFMNGGMVQKMINTVLNFSVNIQLSLSTEIVAYTKDYVQSIPMMRKLKHKIKIILPPLFFDTDADEIFKKSIMDKISRNKVIGFCGRISGEKGIEYLIRAAQNIDRSFLLFAGPYGSSVAGEDGYFKTIKKQLNDSSIPHLFLGSLSGSQLQAFYRTIDILVLPSVNQTEAFGMVQAEAMAAGTPVVASNLPGVRVPIKLTGMGLLVEPQDASGLQKAIEKILRNRKNYAGKTRTSQAIQIFDIHTVYRFYEKLIG